MNEMLVKRLRKAFTGGKNITEKRHRFLADAYAARAEFQRSGAGYALAEVKAYYRAKLQGKRPRKPKLRSWQRYSERGATE
ncbi:MAG: hypothetical protein AABM33_04550 [Pseudomonadota bacterium]